MGAKGDYRHDYALSAQNALLRFIADRGGLSDEAAATALNTSTSTISLVKRGLRNMQMPLAIELSAALGVTIDDILAREGRPARESDARHTGGLEAQLAELQAQIQNISAHLSTEKESRITRSPATRKK